jgi:WD40 repeat protein
VRLKYALDLDSVLCTVRFNGNGSLFAFTDGKIVFIMCTHDGSLVGTVTIPRNPASEDAPPRAICFSPDGRFLAVSAPQHAIIAIEVSTLRVVATLEAHKNSVSAIAFFHNGTKFVSGGFDGKLCVWSVPEFKLWRLVEHATHGAVTKDEMIVALAVGSDDEYLAVGFMNGAVGMYETTFTQPISTFVAHSEFLLNVVISPQDMIATASHDKTAKLWALRGVASCRQVLKGHKDYVLAIAFAANGSVVFTGSKDETIKGWNQKTGDLLFTLKGHKNTVFQIDAHPTENKILACSGDGLVCLWEYTLP